MRTLRFSALVLSLAACGLETPPPDALSPAALAPTSHAAAAVNLGVSPTLDPTPLFPDATDLGVVVPSGVDPNDDRPPAPPER